MPADGWLFYRIRAHHRQTAGIEIVILSSDHDHSRRSTMKTILVTGAAGFIGYHVAEALLERGNKVIGLDNLNDYYDPLLKRARRDRLADRSGFSFFEIDIHDGRSVADL